MSGPVPGLRRLWYAVGALLCALVVYLSLTDDPVDLGRSGGDRIGHALAYAVLMSWFAQLHRTFRHRLAWALLFVAMGVALELLQRLTEHRTSSIADMVANAVGVAAGWGLAPPRLPDLFRYAETWWVRRAWR